MANLKSATKLVKLTEIKPNPDNPRSISEEKFEKLKNSIQSFPKMLELRPLVVDENNVILGGNMRYEACKALGIKEVTIVEAKDLTEEQKREFIIKDNVGFGQWEWDLLANDWDSEALNDWGLDVWQTEDDIDYSILDEEDVSDQLDEMTSGVKKAIQIEFESEHYEEAYELVKFWRERGAYIGGLLMEHLKSEKEKL